MEESTDFTVLRRPIFIFFIYPCITFSHYISFRTLHTTAAKTVDSSLIYFKNESREYILRHNGIRFSSIPMSMHGKIVHIDLLRHLW